MLALTAIITLSACQDGNLEIENAWLRPPPPGVAMTAGYATLRNGTDAQITLCAVHSPAFGQLELHRTELTDGVAQMRPQAQLVLKPGQQIELRPGGLHLMLIEPLADVAVGQLIEFELRACDGQRWPVSATVRQDKP